MRLKKALQSLRSTLALKRPIGWWIELLSNMLGNFEELFIATSSYMLDWYFLCMIKDIKAYHIYPKYDFARPSRNKMSPACSDEFSA